MEPCGNFAPLLLGHVRIATSVEIPGGVAVGGVDLDPSTQYPANDLTHNSVKELTAVVHRTFVCHLRDSMRPPRSTTVVRPVKRRVVRLNPQRAEPIRPEKARGLMRYHSASEPKVQAFHEVVRQADSRKHDKYSSERNRHRTSKIFSLCLADPSHFLQYRDKGGDEVMS